MTIVNLGLIEWCQNKGSLKGENWRQKNTRIKNITITHFSLSTKMLKEILGITLNGM
jgi:hypothetical protein